MNVSALQGATQGASALGINAKAAASTSSSTSSSSSTGGISITANDFLTLLVTELKNQDPTNTTDPNQYVNQLVQINSLQQLIGINSGVGKIDNVLGLTGSSTSSAIAGGAQAATRNPYANATSNSTDKASAIANALTK